MELNDARSLPGERRFWRGRPPNAIAPPAGYRRHPYIEIAAFSVLVLVIFTAIFTGPVSLSLGITWLIYSIVLIGFYFVFGVSGQFAFCQAAMMGVGAYTSALVSEHAGFLVGFAAAIGASGLVALLFALFVQRAGHFYFAIATLGLSQLLLIIFNQWTAFAGPGGIQLSVPAPSIFGLEFVSQTRMLLLTLGVLVIGLVLGMWLERSPLKREAVAMRDRELVASSLGLPIAKIRLELFVLGSCYAGAGGSLLAGWQHLVSSDSFDISLGVGIFLMLILGGRNSIWGGVAGAAFYVVVPAELRPVAQYQDIIYGAILMAVVIGFPGGLAGAVSPIARLVRKRLGRPQAAAP